MEDPHLVSSQETGIGRQNKINNEKFRSQFVLIFTKNRQRCKSTTALHNLCDVIPEFCGFSFDAMSGQI